jgi:hypothetical protein
MKEFEKKRDVNFFYESCDSIGQRTRIKVILIADVTVMMRHSACHQSIISQIYLSHHDASRD